MFASSSPFPAKGTARVKAVRWERVCNVPRRARRSGENKGSVARDGVTKAGVWVG